MDARFSGSLALLALTLALALGSIVLVSGEIGRLMLSRAMLSIRSHAR